MAKFEYRFLKAATGRVNKRVASAYDEQTLLADLERQGIAPLDVVRVPEPSATDAQIAYLRDLGVAVPAGLSVSEASDLITNAKHGKGPAGGIVRAMAERYRVEVTRFSSRETIYRMIVNCLLDAGDTAALAEWYAFRVYRSRCDRALAATLSSPDDPRFALAGQAILRNPQALKSMLAAARSTDTGFRWFGEYRGWQGDSDRTVAFKVALNALQSSGLLVVSLPPAPHLVGKREARPALKPPEVERLDSRRGCLGALLVGVVGLAGCGLGVSLLFGLST